jgi:predicted Na+-dependent transporter
MYEIFLLLVVPVIAGMVLRKVLGTKYALMLRALTSKIAFAGLLLIVILGFVAVIDYFRN